MSRTQFLGVGFFGKSPNVTAQTRKNVYLEFKPKGDKTQVVAYPTPGLELFVNFGDTPCRAQYAMGDFVYVVHRGTFWEINNAGVTTSRGTLLTTTGRCSIIDNGTQVMVVDGTYGYIYTVATTTLAQIVDVDFPANPVTVTFDSGRFIISVVDSGQFYISALYDGTAWDGLDYATAESLPDNLLRVEQDRGDVVMFGEYSTEFWGNTGELDFPYARIGGANLEWGLAARWSVTKFSGSQQTSSLMFLGKNRMGEVKVISLVGYVANPISNNDLEAIINSTTNSDATAFSYMLDGHPMYQINFPTLNRSFLYDGASNVWSELTSSGGRHRCEIGANYIARRYASDYSNGKIYRLKRDAYSDNGAVIVRELTGRHFEVDMDEGFTVGKFTLDMETGVGLASGQGSDPRVMLQYSTDNGHNWSEELWASCGAVGEYLVKAEWWRLGWGREFLFRVRISDPVNFVITGAGLRVA